MLFFEGKYHDLIHRYFSILDEEGDRGSILVAASAVEAELENLIKKRLVTNQDGSDRLIEGNSPCSTFSAKTELAYRIGVICKEVADALNVLRKLRNKVAHNCDSASFFEQSVVDSIRASFEKMPESLRYYEKAYNDEEFPLDKLPNKSDFSNWQQNPEALKKAFKYHFASIAVLLNMSCEGTEKIAVLEKYANQSE